jgi:transcriptional regulator with XRE-family HTH domain
MNRETLSVQMKALRLGASLTQSELAERIGTSQANIARVEGAKITPGLEFIDRWASATGIPLQLTLGSPEPAISPEARRQRVIDAFGPNAFDPWERDPSPVEQETLRRLGIEPSAES